MKPSGLAVHWKVRITADTRASAAMNPARAGAPHLNPGVNGSTANFRPNR
jgi:hypothetical protein